METEITIPDTLQEAVVKFSDKSFAHTVAVAIVWPGGVPTCHHCGAQNSNFMPTYYRYRCRACRKDFTVKNGTIFEDSPLGLDKWMIAMWLVVNCKNGISSYEIHRHLGVCQKTAWFMDHRIRLAMKSGSFKKMTGTVEADETFVGGLEKNKHSNKKLRAGRGGVGKAIVAGVLERGTDGKPSTVKAKVVASRDADDLQTLIKKHVEPGSEVYTDAWKGYNGLSEEFVHDFVDHTVQYANGAVHSNGMENFWSLLKRGLKGTYIAVQPFHLERYVDEQAFRFDERKNEKGDSGRFVKALSQVSGKRLTWNELTQSDDEFARWAW